MPTLLGRLFRRLFPPLRPCAEAVVVTAEVACPYCRRVVRPVFELPRNHTGPVSVMADCPACERLMVLSTGEGG